MANRLEKALLNKNGGNQSEMARFIGVSPQAVQKWIAGETEPRGKNLRRASEFLGVPEAVLKYGDNARDVVPHLRLVDSNTESGPNIRAERKYPVINWVQAGNWREICESFPPEQAEEWRPSHKNLGKCGFVLRVKGASMTAPDGKYSFPEGMLLYVNPEAEHMPGKFVVVRRKASNEATFKKLTLVDGEPYLEALNPDWPNRYLKLEDGDQICGVVVHAGMDMP